MITDKLKKSILKSAIEGELYICNNNKETYTIEFDNIQTIRAECYKKNIISKKQYFIVKNTENYKYKLPDNWILTQIGYLGYVVGGGTPKTDVFDYWNGNISWITPKDMKNFSGLYVDKGERSITEKGLENSSARLIKKDSILCSSRAPIGYLGIAQNELSTSQGFKSLVPLGNYNAKYIYYYLMATVDTLKKSGDGTTFNEISGEDFAKHYIALPSLNEQEKIVEKIEKLFLLLDDLEETEIYLDCLKKEFSNKFEESLFLSSCNGTLTKQKKEESVQDIIDVLEEKLNRKLNVRHDAVPFQIPDNWKWVRFDEIADFNIGKTPPRADSKFWTNKDGYNWVSIADMNNNKYIYNTKEKVTDAAAKDIFRNNVSRKDTLIMSFKLTVGRCSILKVDAFHNEGIISIYPYINNDCFKNYLFKILPFITKYGKTKGAIKGNTLNSKSLKELLIPVPPLEEQVRIVNKLDKIINQYNEIKQTL